MDEGYRVLALSDNEIILEVLGCLDIESKKITPSIICIQYGYILTYIIYEMTEQQKKTNSQQVMLLHKSKIDAAGKRFAG